MNIYLKLLAAGAVALALSQSASASTQVRVGVYAGAPVYYGPQQVRVQQQFVPALGYYGYRHSWRARREAELRREEWRREHWRREHHRGWDGR